MFHFNTEQGISIFWRKRKQQTILNDMDTFLNEDINGNDVAFQR